MQCITKTQVRVIEISESWGEGYTEGIWKIAHRTQRRVLVYSLSTGNTGNAGYTEEFTEPHIHKQFNFFIFT